MLDVVALVRDRADLGLAKGQVGTVVDDPGGDTLLERFPFSLKHSPHFPGS